MGNQISGYQQVPSDERYDDENVQNTSQNIAVSVSSVTKHLLEQLTSSVSGFTHPVTVQGVSPQVLSSLQSAKWRFFTLTTLNKSAALMCARALEKALVASHGCANIFSQLPSLVWSQGSALNQYVEKNQVQEQLNQSFNFSSRHFNSMNLSALLKGNLGEYCISFSKVTLLAFSMCANDYQLADDLVKTGVAQFHDVATNINALHVAVYCLEVREVKRLLDYLLFHQPQQSLSVESDDLLTLLNRKAGHLNHSVLHIATQSRDRSMLPWLLSHHGIDLHAPQTNGMTPLHYAVCLNNVQACLDLLQTPGLDVNRPDGEGDTSLGLSIFLGHSEIVKCILVHPELDIHAIALSQMTALELAIDQGDESILSLVISHPAINLNAHLDADHTTALHLAVEKNSPELVRLLLSHPQVNVNAATWASRETPLHLAIQQNSIELCQLLLSHAFINVNAQTVFGQSPLHLLARDYYPTDMLDHLFSLPQLDLTLVNSDGLTAMMLAHQTQNDVLIRKLLRYAEWQQLNR